jgi:hypothetical protein
MAASSLRELLGVALKDWRRFDRALASAGDEYLGLCNRGELVEFSPDRKGVACRWRWTSDLHAAKVMPSLGRRLMRRALQAHPITRASEPEAGARPQVSFIIGHRGTVRLPLLLATIESIAGQRDCPVECVVVEQDATPQVASHLPGWVRYVHQPTPTAGMPYCRSWAFNLGAQVASAPVLVLHDNDMLVPRDYASGIVEIVARGYEVVNPKRFIFYLDEASSAPLHARGREIPALAATVVQNLEGGGSVAITKEAYERIGGMDESFVGWGGEDNEFWERAGTLKVWEYGWLPIVHLWHAAQPGKQQAENRTAKRYEELARIAPEVRIASLRANPGGRPSGPIGFEPCAG